ncbi:hypothetical protein GcM1_243136 [Golovinomyces cichoracearum]|uniref:Uncharacterized protein n=1 Tax=Golovinomyces cichoracearum TaxID=62708 RepID=A0A420IGL1_9PEZI|nr:hypothetical protein GcM1_243136 [Golovinomyces cichoracearum]
MNSVSSHRRSLRHHQHCASSSIHRQDIQLSYKMRSIRNHGFSQSLRTDKEMNFNLKFDHEVESTTANILEQLRSRIAEIVTKIAKEISISNKSFMEELLLDFHNLFHDFQKAQLLLLERLSINSEPQNSYYEQFNLAQSQLLQVSKERDRLAKEVKSIQRVLDETRNIIKHNDQKCQNPHFKPQKYDEEEIERSSDVKTASYPKRNIDKSDYFSNTPAFNGSFRPHALASHNATDFSFEKKVTQDYLTNERNISRISGSSIDPRSNYIAQASKKQAHCLEEHISFSNEPQSICAPSNSFNGPGLNSIQKFEPIIVKYSPLDQDLSLEFKTKFDKLLNMIEFWCRTYAEKPNEPNDARIAIQNPSLWSYMTNCIHPGDEEASTNRVRELIGLTSTRHMFIMRMITTYIFKNVLSLRNFYGHLDEATEKLQDFERKMGKRGMIAIVRQRIVDQRDVVVKSIIDHEEYNQWRSTRLIQHTMHLQDILGSLLNQNCNLTSAGRDLGAIVVLAFDLCARMHSSSMTFQIAFPEITTKFNSNTMIACDLAPGEYLASQATMIRLKLIITPIVTLRDDRGTTIKAKSLQLARVLTMT